MWQVPEAEGCITQFMADKGLYSQGYGFPVVMYICENWTIKKVKYRRSDAFNCGAGEDS